MSVLSRTNHAYFFDGVSDSIIIPDDTFSIGMRNAEGNNSFMNLVSGSSSNTAISVTSGVYNREITIEVQRHLVCT